MVAVIPTASFLVADSGRTEKSARFLVNGDGLMGSSFAFAAPVAAGDFGARRFLGGMAMTFLFSDDSNSNYLDCKLARYDL